MTASGPQAEELESLAFAAYREGRLEEAVRGFRQAAELYRDCNDPSSAAEAANNLCVALLKANRAAEALSYVSGTPELFESLGDLERSATAYGNLAAATEACGDSQGAQEAYQRAAERFKAVGNLEGRSHVLRALSQSHLRRGRVMEAMSTMLASLEAKPHPRLGERFLRRLLTAPFRLLQR